MTRSLLLVLLSLSPSFPLGVTLCPETGGFVCICIHCYIFNPSSVVPLTLKAWKLATSPPSALHLQTRREKAEPDLSDRTRFIILPSPGDPDWR